MARLQGLPGEALPAWGKVQPDILKLPSPEAERKEAAPNDARATAATGEKAKGTFRKRGLGIDGKRKRGLSIDVEVTAPQPGRKLRQTTIAAQVKAQATEAQCPVCHKSMTQRQVEKHLEMCLALHQSKAEAAPTQEDMREAPPTVKEAVAEKEREEVIVVDPSMDEDNDREAEREAVVESLPEQEPPHAKEKEVLEVEMVGDADTEAELDEEGEEEEVEDLSSDEELDAMEAALRTSMERLVAVRAGEWGKSAGLPPTLQVDSFVDLDDDPALLRVVEQHRPSFGTHVVATTQLTEAQRHQVAQAVIALGGTGTRDIAEATHLVVPTDENGHARESRRMLEAVARGRWALSLDWVLESLAQKEWVAEAPWEVSGISQLSGAILKGAQKSRQRGGQLLCGFSISFNGSFGRQGVPPQKWLESLATAAGAHVEGTSLYRGEGSQNEQRVTLCAQDLDHGSKDTATTPVQWQWLPMCVSAHKLLPMRSKARK